MAIAATRIVATATATAAKAKNQHSTQKKQYQLFPFKYPPRDVIKGNEWHEQSKYRDYNKCTELKIVKGIFRLCMLA